MGSTPSEGAPVLFDNEEEKGAAGETRFDGHLFLDHLRNANELSLGAGDDVPSSNDNTINAGNTKNARNHERLRDLFEVPDDDGTKNEDAFSSSSEEDEEEGPSRSPHPASSLPRPPLRKSVTTSAVPPPQHKPPAMGHGRKVSWGAGLVPPASSSTSPTTQRSLWNLNLGNAGELQRSLRNLNLAGNGDLVNPFEAEAETALLKAIEASQLQRQQQHRPRSDTGTSTIFSQVPDDDAGHEFVVENAPPNLSSSERAAVPDDDRSGSQQSRPLLKRAASRHHRALSVEQTLFELTTAFSAMDKRHHHRHDHDGSNHHHHHHRNRFQSAADELAHNGLRLSEETATAAAVDGGGSMDTSSSSTASSASSAASRWAAIKKNLPTLREEESHRAGSGGTSSDDVDNSSHGDDIELGNGGDDTMDGGIQQSYSNEANKNDQPSNNTGNRRMSTINDRFKDDWQKWNDFFRPHRGRYYSYVKNVLLYILVPLTGIAAILFYFFDNPPTGKNKDYGDDDESTEASASYILLFCCRQIITFSTALALQGFVIDFLALNTRVLLRTVGPVLTLMIVQSKGWPHILFWWTILDFGMLSGTSAFADHWLFYQDAINLFNATNPSGNIANNEWYLKCLAVGLSLSLVVAVKRFLIGIYLGRQQYSHYGGQLAKVMGKMFLVSEVASLARHLEKSRSPMPTEYLGWSEGDFATVTDDGDTIRSTSFSARGLADNVIDTNNRDPLTGSLHFSEKLKLMQLLDQWEEPEARPHASDEIASISAVLRYRKALTFIQKRYPFSFEFGAADNREACIESAQKVYGRLMTHSMTPVLQFEVIALCALNEEGHLDQEKAKQLVKLFRPDRNGNLTMLDFIRSVDAVYKEFRMLQATIENSGRIDKAFENMFNVVFYLVAFTCILAALGFDPLALFLSLSSIILAFAFIIGSASAKYFEGVLFILARRPYGIGDLIQVSNVERDGSLHGALPWCVENVTLFETVVVFLPTNERASLSNGSLANSRVINWARSPQAQFHIFLNFPLDTPYEKLILFKSAVEEYMKARPREWRALNGFRANRVVANENYIEWLVVIQHREAWQQVGRVLDSKANLSSYCNEVARQLGMEYQAPRLPVEIRHVDPVGPGAAESNQLDTEALTRSFQTMAREKHQIRVC